MAANCQLQPHMELSWKEGRKNLGKKKRKGGEEDGERGEEREERSTRVKEDGGGQRRRRTDGRTTVADFVGWLGFQVF